MHRFITLSLSRSLWILPLLLGGFVLTGCNKNPQSARELEKTIKQGDWLVRNNAVEELSKEGKVTLPILVRLLRHKKAAVRMAVATELRSYAPKDGVREKALAPLFQALRDKHPLVKRRASETLILFAKKHKESGEILPHLIEAKRDKDPIVRQYITQALAELTFPKKTSRLALRRALLLQLEDKAVMVSIHAAYGLLKLLWKDLTEDPGDDKVLIAKKKQDLALQKKALAILTTALEKGNLGQKVSVADLLHKLGAKGIKAAPSLIKAFEDPSALVRHNASRALAKMSPKTFSLLTKAFQSPSMQTRIYAAYTLGLVSKHFEDAEKILAEQKGKQKDKQVLSMLEYATKRLAAEKKKAQESS